MFNLVIKVEEGKIYDVVWDNGCFDCDNCQNNLQSISILNISNSQSYDNCYEPNCIDNNKISNNSLCEPKFYITWFGTDKDKRQLKTAGLAMSKFKHYSISSLYSSVKKIFN